MTVRIGARAAASMTSRRWRAVIVPMTARVGVLAAALIGAGFWPAPALGEPMSFKLLPNYSRATFKADAPLETIVGNTAGDGVAGTLAVDPAKPQGASGTIRVDLNSLSSGVARRDEDMRGERYLDTANPANRYAVFEIKSVDIAGALEPGKEVPARVTGILTINTRPVELTANARVTYVKLTTEQLEKDNQKRFGFTTDNIKARATFATTLTNHGIPIPQLFVLKLSNDLQLETDLTFVRQ